MSNEQKKLFHWVRYALLNANAKEEANKLSASLNKQSDGFEFKLSFVNNTWEITAMRMDIKYMPTDKINPNDAKKE